MRVLFLTHAYPRFSGDVAGGFLHLLALGLVKRGHDVRVIAPSESGKGGVDVQDGIRVTRVRYAAPQSESLAYKGTMAGAMKSIAGIATVGAFVAAHAWETWDQPADIVHAHWWVPGGISAGLARLAGGTPYVVTLHGTDVALLKQSLGARQVARLVLRGARAVTTASSYLAEKAARVAGLDPESITVRPMPTAVASVQQESQGGAGVVTVGRLTTQKRIDLLIDAMAVLRSRGITTPLTIVGDGPERAALERRAADHGLSNTSFVGAVPPGKIPAVIGNADVFAFPAVDEGLGLAAAEALMLGVPVVACRSGGVPDIVPDGGAGRLVPPGHLDSFVAAMHDLLKDKDARRHARDVGRILRIQLSPDSVAAVMEHVYFNALGISHHPTSQASPTSHA